MIKRQKLSASLTDTKAELSLVGACQIINDAVTEYMGELKIDNATFKNNYNAFWVYLKRKIVFLKPAKWDEDLVVRTFISSISLAKMEVDAEITNSVGEIVLRSRTELCVLDIETQKIKKLSGLGVSGSLETEEPLDLEFSKFEGGNLSEIGKVKIKYCNIDFCRHTNNLEYIRFILDTYKVAEIENRKISEVMIKYVNQSFEGEEVVIKKSKSGCKDFFLIERDMKPIIQCEIVFEKE